jgi:hypothetical protein
MKIVLLRKRLYESPIGSPARNYIGSLNYSDYYFIISHAYSEIVEITKNSVRHYPFNLPSDSLYPYLIKFLIKKANRLSTLL